MSAAARTHELENLLRARVACIRITTDQEDEAIEAVRAAALIVDAPVQTWSLIDGILASGLADERPPEQSTDPAVAMVLWKQRLEASKPALCLCRDLGVHLADPRVLRAFRDLVAHVEVINRAADAAQGSDAPGHPRVTKRPSPSCIVLVDHRSDLPEIVRAIALEHELPAITDEQIETLARETLRRLNRGGPIEIDIRRTEWQAVLKNLRGLTRRQLEHVLASVIVPDLKLSGDDLHDLIASKRKLFQSSGVLEFVETPTSLDAVGGLGRLKTWLKERQSAFAPEAAKFGLTAPRGMLLLGVQGAGKSLCAKAVAAAWHRPLLKLDPGALYDKYVGESERRLRDTLRQAERMAPLVLWIDEIEKGFASAAAQSTDGGLSKRIFGTLLSWMQDHTAPVFLVATANDIEALPPELMRKGRFDEIFFVDLPGDEARCEIWNIHLRKRGRKPETFAIAELAAASRGFSGAEIEQAVIAALATAFAAGGDITTESLQHAIRSTKPLSVTMRERVESLRRWASERCVPAE